MVLGVWSAPMAVAYDPLAGDYSKDDPLDVRIVAYNHNRSFIEDPSEDAVFERILTAINPDIICFEEFTSSVSPSDVANRLNSILPVAGGGSWQIHFGLLGGIRTVIASRFPLTMTRIDTIPASSTRGVTIALADLPDTDYPVDVYLLGVHLKCCGNPGGSEDASRQDSADAIANWLGDARGVARPSGNNVTLAPNTPMISLGDFNLVGGPQPETTLITGDIQDEGTYGPDVKGDWDNSNLTDLSPADPFTGDTFTWQGNQNFPPGRLDRFFYTDSVVTVANSFILNTDTMTPAALAAAGLQAGDTLTQNSSDHLPIVMDLRLAGVPECTVDADCDDGLFCNGPELCDPVLGCIPGSAPCVGGTWCSEADDACVGLGDGDFEPDGDRDLADYAAFQRCFGAEAGPACYPANLTGVDGLIDLDDFESFAAGLTGP
ncbi:MAG: endonuclease/exonuclease/phosphatase family protein [Planctomycetes bacterium]|nr:endonuclease/exonuclease/phosphatase family protein [Planctomycetota bacterium]